MVENFTLEILRGMAESASLRLGEDELQRLLPGVIRARQQAAELGALLDRTDEPAGAFRASTTEPK